MKQVDKYTAQFELIIAVMAFEEVMREEMIEDDLTQTLLIDRSRFEEHINRLKSAVPGAIDQKAKFRGETLGKIVNRMLGMKQHERIRREWSEAEIYILKDKYTKGNEIEMAELLRRPIQSIWTKLQQLGLR